jgi:hypothetical protein
MYLLTLSAKAFDKQNILCGQTCKEGETAALTGCFFSCEIYEDCANNLYS